MKLDKKWEFQEEQYGASSKGQEEKQPKLSAKEDPYTLFHKELKAVLNSKTISHLLRIVETTNSKALQTMINGPAGNNVRCEMRIPAAELRTPKLKDKNLY
jgi:hypothetical protein